MPSISAVLDDEMPDFETDFGCHFRGIEIRFIKPCYLLLQAMAMEASSGCYIKVGKVAE